MSYMISNQLVGRLRTIANFIPQKSVLADIGCDHGRLSVGLSGHCSHVWAIDISPLAIQGKLNYHTAFQQKMTTAKIDNNVYRIKHTKPCKYRK